MAQRFLLKIFTKAVMGTLVLAKAASGYPIVAPSPEVNADWLAVRRDLEGSGAEHQFSRIMTTKVTEHLASGMSLDEIISMSYLAGSEKDRPLLDQYWLNHELIRCSPDDTEKFLVLRASLVSVAPRLLDAPAQVWKAVVPYDDVPN